MQCIVHSKIRQTACIFKHLVNSKIQQKYNIKSLLTDVTKIPLEEINIGHGLLIEIDGYKCIVTCFHIVGKATMNVEITLDDIEQNICTEQCKIEINIEEYDISILKLIDKNNELKYNFYNVDDILNFNESSHHAINYKSLEGLLETKLILNEIDIKKINILQKHIKCVLSPKIPVICIESDFLPDNINGLSGASIVDSTGAPVAMLSNEKSRQINCIPLKLIIKFIKEIKKHKMAFKISNLFIESNVILDHDTNTTCHMIKNGYNLSYQTTKKRKHKFLADDIIQKVNNINFNPDGLLLHSEIGFNVELSTYVMIESLSNSYINFDMYRNTNGEYKQYPVSLLGIYIDNVYNIQMFNNNNYFVWKNFVFTELSYELINEFKLENIIPFELFNALIPAETKSKIIIVYDGSTIQFVEKIGNKNVNSLDDIITNSKIKQTINCRNIDGMTIKFNLF